MHRFLKDFCNLSKVLLDKLAQNGQGDHEPFPHDPEVEKCTQALKAALLASPVLAHPRFKSKEKFILDTDFSAANRAIGKIEIAA